MESLKQFCPLEIAKNIGRETIQLFNTVRDIRAYVGGITFEREEV